MGLVPLSVNDLTFEEIMKKIFAYILAVAAFVGCATDIKDVVAPSTTLTAPMEVSVAESRVFDADLNWSWESSDVILAYQRAGAWNINMLSLNNEGNFANSEFVYSTDEPAEFHFLYPMTSLSERGLTVEQTGKWSPVLYGIAENTTISQIGAVQMNYLSSAFEIRVWENGRAARKNITKAVITSENDFIPAWDMITYAQSLEGKELSLDVNGDTAIFNLGEGDFVFALTLTDAEGKVWTKELPAKNFVAGKRTILNVEWAAEEALEASVTSWYEDYANNNGTALEGGVIYVTAVGGEPVVTVDGVEVAVVDGKVSGVASGTHNVVVTVKGQELVNRSIVVTSIPSVNATVRTSYSNNGAKATTNDINGTELQVTASLSDSSIPSSLISSSQVTYGSATTNIALGSTSKYTLALGQYNCAVKVVLANGYACSTPSYTTHVTGIPYTLNIASNDGTWSEEGNVTWNAESSVRLGKNQWSTGDAYIARTFHIPADLTVKVTANGTVAGTGSIIKVSNTATITVGSTTVVEKSQKGNSVSSWSCSNASASMSSSSNTVRCNSSYNLEQAKVDVKALTIQY